MNQTRRRIVILGGGTAGWMAANLMAKKWIPDVANVTVIVSPNIGTIGVGEGSTPTLRRFFETLGIPDEQWMSKCHATYKNSIKFTGWSPTSGVSSYRHPFISQTDVFTERALHVNCMTRRLGLDVNTAPGDFLLNGVLCRYNKAPLASENFPFRTEYGYHFDATLLGKYLESNAIDYGVTKIEKDVVQVQLNEHGSIDGLVCEDGHVIKADFFVDCTGFRSLLLEKSLGVAFIPFSENLFNDSAVVLQTERESTITPETESVALSNGWAWKIPLTTRVGNGYVYSSSFISKDDAEKELRMHVGLANSDVDARHLKMRVGQAARHWEKNCLALGLSQGFIEPLEATALHLVQISIERFMEAFEKGQYTDKYQGDFNREISIHFERIRDYIVAHYKLNTRNDSDYWRANRNNENISESLGRLLEAWYGRGELEKEIGRQNIHGHFTTTSWHCLLAGYGIFPPLSAKQPGRGDQYVEQNIADFIEKCSLNFPVHSEILASMHD